MEIKDIKNAAGRNKTMEQYELAHNKLSNEVKNIIKPRVEQELKYCELKEQFDTQIKINDNLQTNLQDVTRNLESISIKYRDEINEKNELLDKIISTREISQILETYFNTLKDNLGEQKLTINTTHESLQELSKKVVGLEMRGKQKDEIFAKQINHLQEKLKLADDNKENLLNIIIYKPNKEQFAKEIQDVKAQLEQAVECKYDLTYRLKDLSQELEAVKKDNEEKQNTMLEIQQWGKQVIDEFESNMSELKNDNNALNEMITVAYETFNVLSEALPKQQESNEALQQQINDMNDKIFAYEEELILDKDNIEKLKQILADVENACNEKQDMIDLLFQQRNELNEEISSIKSAAENENKEKDEIITDLNKSKAELQKEYYYLRVALGDRDERIKSLSGQCLALTDTLRSRDEDRRTLLQEIEGKLGETDKLYKNRMSEALAKQRDEYAGKIIAKDNMLQQVTERMQELEFAKAQLESRMERIITETEGERRLHTEQAKLADDQINVLENYIVSKEDEGNIQKKLILHLKAERDALQNKIEKSCKEMKIDWRNLERRGNNDSTLPDNQQSFELILPEDVPSKIPKTPNPELSVQRNQTPHSTASIPVSPVLGQSRIARNNQAGPSKSTSSNRNATEPDVPPRKIPKTPNPESSVQRNQTPHSTASTPVSPVLGQSRIARNNRAGPSKSTSSNRNATEPIPKKEKKFFKSERPARTIQFRRMF